MSAIATNNWADANQHYLSAALALVRNAVERRIAHVRGTTQVEVQQQGVQDAINQEGTINQAPDVGPDLSRPERSERIYDKPNRTRHIL